MKSLSSIFSPLIVILGLGSPSIFAQSAPAEAVPAIIVLRHGKDADEEGTKKRVPGTHPQVENSEEWFLSAYWREVTGEVGGVNSAWPNYSHNFFQIDKDGNRSPRGGVKIAAHALSGDWKTISPKVNAKLVTPHGEMQAKHLGESLDGFVAGKFKPISRAITLDPTSASATPNPFDTLWPYVTAHPSVDYDLVEIVGEGSDWRKFPGIKKLIAHDKILPEDGNSVVICWTGEGLGTLTKEEPGLIEQLLVKYLGGVGEDQKSWINKDNIGKCADIFVFYGTPGRGEAKHFYFDYAAKTYVEKK